MKKRDLVAIGIGTVSLIVTLIVAASSPDEREIRIEEQWSPPPPVSVPEEDLGRTACTKDAKICPDGSTVGRIPPDCAFALCSGEEG